MTDRKIVYADKALVAIGVVAFVVLIIVAWMQDVWLATKIVVVCAISFALVTLLRKVINLPRPKLEGGIYDKRRGESFPSRHTFSMMMIGLSWFNVNIIVGSIVCGLALVLGGLRIAIGAHYPRDIYGAIVIAITLAGAGYLFF